MQVCKSIKVMDYITLYYTAAGYCIA